MCPSRNEGGVGRCLLRPLPWIPLTGLPLPAKTPAQAPLWGPQFSLPLSPLLDLEQSILRVLKDAGSPVEIAQLLKKCQVPKKRLNQVLYRMKKESLVARIGLTTWCLCDGGTGEVVPAEVAQPSQGNLPSWGARFRPSREQFWYWTSSDLGLHANTVAALHGCVMSPHRALISFSGQWR